MKHGQFARTTTMNTYQENQAPGGSAEPVRKRKGPNTSRLIQRILSGEFLMNKALVKHIPFIAFMVFLFILNIGLVYYFENTAREKANLQNELNELRSQFNTTMSRLETSKQQSQVAQEIEQLGLKEINTPPKIIDVEPGFFETEQ